jgi:hypothetical protein
MKAWCRLVLFGIGAMCGWARADVLGPCAFSLVSVPSHPSPSERIGLRVTGGIFGPGAGPAVAQATVQSHVVYLDVVLTRERDAFPSYHPIGDVVQDVFDYVGPFAAGVYPVVISTRSFVDGVTNVPCSPVVASLTVDAVGVPGETADAIELYSPSLDRYHLTADEDEARTLETTGGFVRTGRSFKVYELNASGGRGIPVYRFVAAPGAGLNAHFFTASYREYLALLRTPEWQFEQQPFEAGFPDSLTGECPDGLYRVYRLFNPRNGDHRWTIDAGLRAVLAQQGWIPEGYGDLGVAMCSPPV